MHVNKKGFTLIELLVVIGIIGLLSTLAIVSLNTTRAKARDTKRISDVKELQTALEVYFSDNGKYPVHAAAVTLGSAGFTALCGSANFAGSCVGNPYAAVVPLAPTPADGTTCQTGTNNDYRYISANGSTYSLTFCLGGAIGQVTGNTLHTASPVGIQ